MQTCKKIFIESLSKIGLPQDKVNRIIAIVESLDDVTLDSFSDKGLNSILDKYEQDEEIAIMQMFTQMHKDENNFHSTQDPRYMQDLDHLYADYCTHHRHRYNKSNIMVNNAFAYYDKQYGPKILTLRCRRLEKQLDALSQYDSELYRELINENINPDDIIRNTVDELTILLKYFDKYLKPETRTLIHTDIKDAKDYLAS